MAQPVLMVDDDAASVDVRQRTRRRKGSDGLLKVVQISPTKLERSRPRTSRSAAADVDGTAIDARDHSAMAPVAERRAADAPPPCCHSRPPHRVVAAATVVAAASAVAPPTLHAFVVFSANAPPYALCACAVVAAASDRCVGHLTLRWRDAIGQDARARATSRRRAANAALSPQQRHQSSCVPSPPRCRNAVALRWRRYAAALPLPS